MVKIRDLSETKIFLQDWYYRYLAHSQYTPYNNFSLHPNAHNPTFQKFRTPSIFDRGFVDRFRVVNSFLRLERY